MELSSLVDGGFGGRGLSGPFKRALSNEGCYAPRIPPTIRELSHVENGARIPPTSPLRPPQPGTRQTTTTFCQQLCVSLNERKPTVHEVNGFKLVAQKVRASFGDPQGGVVGITDLVIADDSDTPVDTKPPTLSSWLQLVRTQEFKDEASGNSTNVNRRIHAFHSCDHTCLLVAAPTGLSGTEVCGRVVWCGALVCFLSPLAMPAGC